MKAEWNGQSLRKQTTIGRDAPAEIAVTVPHDQDVSGCQLDGG